MGKKYQIFVSSTYQDLKEEREAVIKTILKMAHIPVGMEMFNAGDDEQWKVIQRRIDETDYYILIIAHRYGSKTAEGISFTEKEYDYAISVGVPVIGFIIDDAVKWPPARIDDGDDRKKLDVFKEKVRGKFIEFWRTADGIQGQVAMAIGASIDSHPRPGWVRPSDVADPEMTKELTRLSGENAQLRDKINAVTHASQEERAAKQVKLISTLKANKYKPGVWLKESKDWDYSFRAISLADLFGCIGAEAMGDIAEERVALLAAIELGATISKLRKAWPVPMNFVRARLADLHVLNLVEVSKKKRSLQDKETYWTLTADGRELYADLRRIRLERGTVVAIEKVPSAKKGRKSGK